jgi:hypothetical protein
MARVSSKAKRTATKTSGAARTSKRVSRSATGRGAGRSSAQSRSSPGQKSHTAQERSAYDALKEFEGKRYTGMKIGRGHKWQYDSGEWTEKKITPDKWEIRYAVTKRRRGRAPEGSGVPVGTGYHWYILAHQTVTKLDANSYTTDLAGVKYKLSHKRADKASWSASDRAQRRRLIQILKETIAELEKDEAAKEPAVPIAKPITKAPKKGTRGAHAKRHLAAA